MIILSEAGGMDIEQVAKDTPEKIKTIAVNPAVGLPRATALELADFFGLGNIGCKL